MSALFDVFKGKADSYYQPPQPAPAPTPAPYPVYEPPSWPAFPTYPPMPEPRDYAGEQAVKDAAEKKRKAAGLAKGAASTILTGGLGIQESPQVKTKQLFGQ